MVSRVIPVTSFDLVIFGATGDLAKRKIFPGLFRRFLAGQMPKDSQIVGAARSSLSIKTFNDLVENSIKNFIEINYHQEDLKNFCTKNNLKDFSENEEYLLSFIQFPYSTTDFLKGLS